jgi:tetratricopeptide (TPR) repeat protein
VARPALRRAIAAYESGAWAEAEAACTEVLRHSPRQPDALQILGNIRARSGDMQSALPLFEAARAADPGNPFILNSLGGAYAAAGRLVEAREALEAALAIDAGFPWALQNLGGVLMELGERADARRCFERALAAKPDHVESLASLADLAEKENRLEDASTLAGRALALAPDFAPARIVLAELDRRAARYAAVESAMRQVLAGRVRPAVEATARSLLGRALEGLGRFAEAFASFKAANELDRRAHAARLASLEFASSPESLARLTAFMRATDPARWPKPVPDGLPDPVFLVGFPRSGTTLLQQVLAGHPQLVTLEERENLRDANGPLVLEPGALDRWESLPPSALTEYRRAYWRRVKKALPKRVARAIYLDKLPMNLALLPLVHLLFPQAKIVLLVRDPRDVILSCFRSRFAMNAAMFRFLALDEGARYYDAVMASSELARARLPLALHALKYEDLVADLRAESTRLMDFLDLSWSNGLLSHAETAQRRAVLTPSATQVIEPVYTAAVGQWRRYERELAPVMPLLEPWVRRLGY